MTLTEPYQVIVLEKASDVVTLGRVGENSHKSPRLRDQLVVLSMLEYLD